MSADSPERLHGLLGGARGYGDDDYDDDLRQPIRLSSSGSQKRSHYGSQQAPAALGQAVSKFTSYVIHHVQSDDTWARLSLRYSIGKGEIQRYNKMYEADEIMSRTELRIPINDENKSSVDPALIVTGGSAGPAEESQSTPEPAAEVEAITPTSATKAKDDFFARFDSNFGKIKESVLLKESEVGGLAARTGVGMGASYGGRPSNTDPRIGNGIRGDTAHLSYQNSGKR